MSTESNSRSFNPVFLAQSPLTDERITRLANWGRILQGMALVKGIEGNLSFRTRLGFIISGTNVALEALGPETVAEVTGVVYGLNKTSVYVKGLVVPSRETILHSQIYDLREDVNAIFHVHDSAVMDKAVKLGIPVTDKEEPAGSLELAQAAVKLLKFNRDASYFVLKNHGVITLGATLDEAGKLTEEMRDRAKNQATGATGRKKRIK